MPPETNMFGTSAVDVKHWSSSFSSGRNSFTSALFTGGLQEREVWLKTDLGFLLGQSILFWDSTDQQAHCLTLRACDLLK